MIDVSRNRIAHIEDFVECYALEVPLTQGMRLSVMLHGVKRMKGVKGVEVRRSTV